MISNFSIFSPVGQLLNVAVGHAYSYRPRRRIGYFPAVIEENERRFVFRRHRRKRAVAVGKINDTLEVCKFMLLYEHIHMLKHRAKIRSTEAL